MDTIGDRYHRLHPSSLSRYQQAQRLLPDGVTHDTRWMTPFPIYVTHALGPGSGMWMETSTSTT